MGLYMSTFENMPAYKRMMADFVTKGYTTGEGSYGIPFKPDLRIMEVPERQRYEYLLYHLSGCHDDYVEYVKARPKQFNKQFFKDCMAKNYYALYFEMNIFEWMPDEFIDEELVMCAMIRSMDMRYCDRRDECDDWFYSVHRRRPELLTPEMYILGARCFASKRRGVNRFLNITPPEYRTVEYYHALCIHNDTPVMEDIPKEILTSNFIVDVLNEDMESIRCFTEAALEMMIPVQGRGPRKVWQAVMIVDGYKARYIPLNEERIKYFFSLYDKDSSQYRYGLKDHYKQYLREKSGAPAPSDSDTLLAGAAMLLGVTQGISNDAAVDASTGLMRKCANRRAQLPIHFGGRVPAKYAKIYDNEEYLTEIYKKCGIEILGEAGYYYYNVDLPDDIEVVIDERCRYLVKRGDDTILEYYDVGPFYNRRVYVDEIYISL